MSDFWLNCDSCGRQNISVTFVNGMRFCAKCYQETFGNTNLFYDKDLINKVADLEAKLADIERCAENNKKVAELVSAEHNTKIEKLEQQLAEKDKEIEQLKKFDDLNKTFFNLFRTAFKEPNKVDDLFNTLKTMQEKQDQDKISFALEQLEKVKNIIDSKVKNINKRLDDLNIKIVCESTSRELSTYEEIVKEIDNQIKQLKEGK